MDALFLLGSRNLWVHTKNPKALYRWPPFRLPERPDMPVTAGVHMEAKEGSQDLFVPLETQDAEL